jgi:predicted aspartyl protease
MPGRNVQRFTFQNKESTDPFVIAGSSNCIIPFSRAGNLIIIKAKVDTTEGNFILDTGAPGLVLNLTYFRNYPATIKEGESGGATGTATSVMQTLADSLIFGEIKYFKVESDLLNLGHIENSKGIKILGLLGMSLFKKFEMIIDYENNLIYLHHIQKKEKGYQNEMLRDNTAYSTYSIEIFENKILTYLYSGGKKLRFVIDTGAESNILDSRLPGTVMNNVTISRRVLLTGSTNQKVEALYGDLKNATMGKESLANFPVLITNLERMCYSYNTCINGMLGFDFLSLHKIGFNFVTGKMYIWK